MGYSIKRSETKELLDRKHWILLYGRRKVGKTFMLRELCEFENYYYIRNDLAVIAKEGVTISLENMLQEVKTLLSQNKTVVIDEFQRLQPAVLEGLMLLHPKGRLILSGSSLRIVKKIFEPGSPMLGFFTPFKIGFIKPSDILQNLSKEFESVALIELATFLREPWSIPVYNHEKPVEFVYSLITASKYIITALIGEIFTEEERELTKKYEAILSLVGSGVWQTKELTSILYSRGLIPEPSPTHLIQYLKNLEEVELIESIKLHKTKGRFYRLASPIMNIYYYLDSRYNIGSREVSLDEIKPTLEKLMNLEIQNFIADFFCWQYDGRKEYFISAEKEVDFIITRRNKTEIIGEVKWKKITHDDVGKFIKNSENLLGRKVLICKSSKINNQELDEKSIEIMQADELIKSLKR